jgi:hypothetical protein
MVWPWDSYRSETVWILMWTIVLKRFVEQDNWVVVLRSFDTCMYIIINKV